MTQLLPGSTIGILGGGQLARMLVLEARRMGYRVAVLDPDAQCPAAALADSFVQAALNDPGAARKLAEQSDVITLDTEHVPADFLEQLEPLRPVRPGAGVLRVIQDRLTQRRFLDAQDAPQVRYASVESLSDLRAAVAQLGLPAVLKTRRAGYDGKGQARITSESDVEAAWQAIGEAPAVLEEFVDFQLELSVLLARGTDGRISFYECAENEHRAHVLRTSRVPARVPATLAASARALGARLAAALDHVGMLALELFLLRNGKILVNEMAPRTHNSGHPTWGACATSQFEQHLRAICGLTLGDTTLVKPAVLLNLLGDLWRAGEPRWQTVLKHPNAKLHLYGKRHAAPGRKMGHVLILDDDGEAAFALAEQIETALAGPEASLIQGC